MYVNFSTCSSLLGSKGESPLTRLTAASLIPGGAWDSAAVADELSEAVAALSASEGDSKVGCLDELLKISEKGNHSKEKLLQSFAAK